MRLVSPLNRVPFAFRPLESSVIAISFQSSTEYRIGSSSTFAKAPVFAAQWDLIRDASIAGGQPHSLNNHMLALRTDRSLSSRNELCKSGE